ncbi:Proline-rich protein 23A3 [Lemmus lemmus]
MSTSGFLKVPSLSPSLSGRGFIRSKPYIRNSCPPTTPVDQPVILVALPLSKRVHRVSCRNQTTAVPEQRTPAPKCITCIGPWPAPATKRQECIGTNMLGMGTQSLTAYQMPSWDPQPEEVHPAKRRRLQEPADLWSLAQPDLEASAMPTSEEFTSTVFVPTGCAVKLRLEGVDLLLEPNPSSVMQVSLPGHTILLVAEGQQASSQHGQPVFWTAGMQEAAVLGMPQDHHVFALHQEFNSASLSHIEGFSNVSLPQEDSQEGLWMSWRNTATLLAPELLSPFMGVVSPWFPGQMPCPCCASSPPSAERYAPGSLWSLEGSMWCALPSSPLQPLPPSPPPSHQEHASQILRKAPRPKRKAWRRLVF